MLPGEKLSALQAGRKADLKCSNRGDTQERGGDYCGELAAQGVCTRAHRWDRYWAAGLCCREVLELAENHLLPPQNL